MLLNRPIQPEDKTEQNLCRNTCQMLSKVGQCISTEIGSTALQRLKPAANGLKQIF